MQPGQQCAQVLLCSTWKEAAQAKTDPELTGLVCRSTEAKMPEVFCGTSEVYTDPEMEGVLKDKETT